MKQWYVYIVRCHDKTLYTGSTDNVHKRIATHNSGKGAKYTRARRPVEVVYAELCVTRSAALKRELAIKSLSRQKKLDLVNNFISKKIPI